MIKKNLRYYENSCTARVCLLNSGQITGKKAEKRDSWCIST